MAGADQPVRKVTIIGGGVSGTEAAKIALGMRAIVRVLDTTPADLPTCPTSSAAGWTS